MLERILIRSHPVPEDPPRRRGATTLAPRRDRFAVFRAVMAAVPWGKAGMGAVIVLLAAMVPWGMGQVLAAMDRQIMAIDVTGEFSGENAPAVERSVSGWVGRSFFATDLSEIKTAVEERPWVASAAVRRAWPDRLEVEIREHKPLAYWDEGRLVSRSGVLFTPPNPQAAGRLPTLSGPDGRVRDVIAMARMLAERLAAHDLGFAGLALEQRGAWTLTLANGIEVVLGRDQVAERFERFLTVYETRLASRSGEVSRVDARYTNGVSVRWKADGTGETKS
ncbi:MAG: cell division protein FtsQ/DivIB [Pseudomonadota bacterium]|nr:cell division protein FtsQ/DivIB [Pseudomonadota bacterium]